MIDGLFPLILLYGALRILRLREDPGEDRDLVPFENKVCNIVAVFLAVLAVLFAFMNIWSAV